MEDQDRRLNDLNTYAREILHGRIRQLEEFMYTWTPWLKEVWPMRWDEIRARFERVRELVIGNGKKGLQEQITDNAEAIARISEEMNRTQQGNQKEFEKIQKWMEAVGELPGLIRDLRRVRNVAIATIVALVIEFVARRAGLI